jgi:hypothetical protein
MSSQELSIIDDGDSDIELSSAQLSALEKLSTLGAEPAEIDAQTGKSIYDKNPQIRALQMVFEGKFGGPGRGQGRPKQGKRAAEVLADEIRRAPHIKKMHKAIDRALSKKAGVRANLDAVKLSIDIERGERALQIKEEEHDTDMETKEELIATIFQIAADPTIQGALESSAEEIEEAVVIEDNIDGDEDGNITDSSRTEEFDNKFGSTSSFKKIRNNSRTTTKKKRG